MTLPVKSRRRAGFYAAACIGSVVALAIAPLTLAASPVHGAKYKGHVRGAGVSIGVTFKVSRSGTRLSSFAVDVPNLPNKCGYGGDGQVRPGKARIKGGKFTLTLTETIGTGKSVATAKVTGRFKSGRKEAGTFKTMSGTGKCSGSFSYSTGA